MSFSSQNLCSLLVYSNNCISANVCEVLRRFLFFNIHQGALSFIINYLFPRNIKITPSYEKYILFPILTE